MYTPARSRQAILSTLVLLTGLFSAHFTSASAADRQACLRQHRAYVQVNARLPSSVGLGAEDIAMQVRDTLQDAGLTLVDPDMADDALRERQERMVAMGDVVGALELAKDIKATLLINARVSGTQQAIRGLAAGLYNVSAQMEMKASSTRNGQMMANVRKSSRKPGLGLDAQLPALLDSLLPGMSAEMIKKVCRKTRVIEPVPAAPADDAPETVDTGASQIDSL